jgi:hypothetical protein
VKHCRRGGGGRGGGRRRFHCHRRRHRGGEPPAAMAGGPTQVGAASLGSGARRERVHFCVVGCVLERIARDAWGELGEEGDSPTACVHVLKLNLVL